MSRRARLGKLLIGAAVLLPGLIIGVLIAESQLFGLSIQRATGSKPWVWLAADGAVLLVGLMLSRGEDL